MSTTINVTVGGDTLLDKLQQEQQAARQAHLEQQSRIILEREASAERTTALATQGLDAQGNVLSGRLNVPAFRRDEIGASRTGSELVVGGVVFKYTRYTGEYTTTINTEVTVSVADVESSSPTVFTIPGQTVSVSYPQNSGTSGGGAGNVYYWSTDSNAPFFIPREPPVNSSSLTIYESFLSSVNKSFHFVVPTGDGGAYVILHINDTIDFVTITETRQYSAQRTVITCQGENFDGTKYSYYKNWESIISENRAVSRQVQEIAKRSNVLCFKVKNKAVTKVDAPAALVALVEKYNSPPPYQPNASFAYLSGLSGQNRFYNANGADCGFGTYTLVEPLDGSITYATVNYYDPNLDKPFGPNADLSLIKYLGGTAIGPTPRSDRQAWGPSFALAMDKADTDLTAEQSTDYSYIENTVVGAKPRLYASPCTLSGTCPDASAVGWDQSLTRPSTLDGSISLDNFKANPKNTLSIPAYATVPGSGYDILFHTNWSDKNRCRQALTKLGLTP